ncbi:MAG: hypothetical protein IKF72_01920 [Kiritimatiellae bacterium]|nr:hypothetical protein [Kiritimatiellia bacterium]
MEEAQVVEWARLAMRMGYPSAAVVAADCAMSRERIFAELLIAYAVGLNLSHQEWADVQPIPSDSGDVEEIIPLGPDDEWLLDGKPEGTVLPPPSGRNAVRTPNLKSANPSFAALLVRYVRDKFNGDAPQVYRAARVSRQTYSAIISNELRPVSKETAISFVLALKLSIDEANVLLRAAGHALSEFLLEDIIYQSCIVAGIYEIGKVDEILRAHAAKPLDINDDMPF